MASEAVPILSTGELVRSAASPLASTRPGGDLEGRFVSSGNREW